MKKCGLVDYKFPINISMISFYSDASVGALLKSIMPQTHDDVQKIYVHRKGVWEDIQCWTLSGEKMNFCILWALSRSYCMLFT